MDMAAHLRYLERVEKLELREKVKFFTEWKDEAVIRERIARDDLEAFQDQMKTLREAIESMIENADDGNTSRVCREGAAALSASTPVGEREDSKYSVACTCSCHTDPLFLYQHVGDCNSTCSGRLWDLNVPHQPETQTVCPCAEAYDKDVCSACWEECRMDDSHFEGCVVSGCFGSGTITPEETNNG